MIGFCDASNWQLKIYFFKAEFILTLSTEYNDTREPKTKEELQVLLAKVISEFSGTISVLPDAIDIGPGESSEGSWYYGYDSDAEFGHIVKENRVALRQYQSKFRLVV